MPIMTLFAGSDPATVTRFELPTTRVTFGVRIHRLIFAEVAASYAPWSR